MKNLLLIFFIFISVQGFCQVNSVMPAEANALYDNAIHKINPAIRNLIEKNARDLKGRDVNVDSLSRALSQIKLLRNLGQRDLETMSVLIMVQISRNADAELKSMVVNMHHTQNGEDGTGDSSKRVEKILSAKSQIAESVSMTMKKIPGSSEITLDNFK